MTVPPVSATNSDRRRFPRYYVSSHMTLAIEDESIKESIGLGEPGDISLGGLRVRNLPACANVRVGARLGLLIMDPHDALSLRGEVIHHGTYDAFGVEFHDLTPSERRGVRGIIERLHVRDIE